MILGSVNNRNEAEIGFTLVSPTGEELPVTAVIDTGFSGYVRLPLSILTAIGADWERTETYVLGDDSRVDLDIYRVIVLWGSESILARAVATEGEALIGMKLLHGCNLSIDVIDGGAVRVSSLR